MRLDLPLFSPLDVLSVTYHLYWILVLCVNGCAA